MQEITKGVVTAYEWLFPTNNKKPPEGDSEGSIFLKETTIVSLPYKLPAS